MSRPRRAPIRFLIANRHTVRLVLGMLAILATAVAAGRWLRVRSLPVTASSASLPVRAEPSQSSLVERGGILFQVHCAKCHGPAGQGEPEALALQKPPPRDLSSRPWRFEVSLESIRNVTMHGIPGTAMPAHREALTPNELESVVAHTYRLATASPVAVAERSSWETALDSAGFFPDPTSPMAPALALVDADGNRRTLADERGRVVLLHFWGTTCEHCLTGLPRLQQLADQWRDKGLTVLNITADAEDARSSQELVNRQSPSTRAWIDETGLATAQYEVQAWPTIWLIDRAGRRLACARGMKDWQSPKMQDLMAHLLSRTTGAAAGR